MKNRIILFTLIITYTGIIHASSGSTEKFKNWISSRPSFQSFLHKLNDPKQDLQQQLSAAETAYARQAIHTKDLITHQTLAMMTADDVYNERLKIVRLEREWITSHYPSSNTIGSAHNDYNNLVERRKIAKQLPLHQIKADIAKSEKKETSLLKALTRLQQQLTKQQ